MVVAVSSPLRPLMSLLLVIFLCSANAPATTTGLYIARSGDPLWRMDYKDDTQLLYLTGSRAAAKRTAVPIASGRQVAQTANYVVHVAVGTPLQTFLMALDTSNDAAWVPCSCCAGCASAVFDTAKSPAYRILPYSGAECCKVPNLTCPSADAGAACSFNLTYNASSFSANLSQDALSLGVDTVPAYTFACLQHVSGAFVLP